MKIVIFSDVHGRLLLPFVLVDRLQRERGIHIDLILQCGDMGVFPDHKNMDRATVKHAKRDPDELGFKRHFFRARHDIEAIVNRTDCDMLCVRGNHEDHEWLDELEKKSPFPGFSIDPYQRIWVAKTGHVHTYGEGEEQIRIVGIGRVGDQKGTRTAGKFVQDYERAQLKKLKPYKTEVDVLISHDWAGYSGNKGFGTEEVREFLDIHKPLLHFFGHIGPHYKELEDENGVTKTYKAGESVFEENGQLPLKNMLLLDWKGPYDFTVEPIEADWLWEYRIDTWKQLAGL